MLTPSSDSLVLALQELKFIVGNKTQTSDALCVPVMLYGSVGHPVSTQKIFHIFCLVMFGKEC